MAPSPVGTKQGIASPDGVLRAAVLTSPIGESSVQIQRPRSGVLLSRFSIGNGSHRYGIVRAEWTANSQFFVVSAQAADGHQPWAYPIWVYSRAKNRVFDLTKMGFIATADFTLKPPDVIETALLRCESAKEKLQPLPWIVSLRRLVSDESPPAAPCPNPTPALGKSPPTYSPGSSPPR